MLVSTSVTERLGFADTSSSPFSLSADTHWVRTTLAAIPLFAGWLSVCKRNKLKFFYSCTGHHNSKWSTRVFWRLVQWHWLFLACENCGGRFGRGFPQLTSCQETDSSLWQAKQTMPFEFELTVQSAQPKSTLLFFLKKYSHISCLLGICVRV